MLGKSTPNFEEFNPNVIPFQKKVVTDYFHNLDYSIGTHELLFSGSVGSSKSLLAAFLIIDHCLKYNKAKVLICRRTLPDLKKTLFTKLIDHLEGVPFLKGKVHITETTASIKFWNGSEIISGYWADKRYMKFRSLELSMAVIEEAVENTGDDYKAIAEIRQRVGRLPHIKENLIIYCTNPGGPSHPLYKYFFDEQSPTRHVYFSLTEQNPFLPRTYIEQLKRDLDPKEAQRMLYGKWVEIDRERIYYAYNENLNFKRQAYTVRNDIPVSISYDFNIGMGKPMSLCLSQYDVKKDTFHFFDEVIVHGFRTQDTLDEMSNRGIFEMPVTFEIHGDATGGARTTASNWSNYEIIENFLSNYRTKTGLKLNYQLFIPKSNPPIKERHNIVNGYCSNSLGEHRLFVYEKCKTINEGLKLTTLKKGADYIEDDGPNHPYQHVTTALGYRVSYTAKNKVLIKGGNI